ncbi:MAG: carboxypeptidase regulatory-like domain-containing protein, partial [Pyrinomonadaceae bacterium]
MPTAYAAGAAGGAAGRKSLGTITGSVRDSKGNALAGALVTLLKEGADEVVKQTRSAADGTFTTRVAPGRYILRAAADGFNAVTSSAVKLNSSEELVYRFNLEPAGQGRTVPERRLDRDDPKFKIRASHTRRSIFQVNDEADETIAATMEAIEDGEAADDETAADDVSGGRARPQGVVETYYAASKGGRALGAGLNFAFASPVNEKLDLIFAGQLGSLDRLEATARLRAGARHRLSATLGGARLSLSPAGEVAANNSLGQFSVRAVDEWVVRDGVVVVLGLDYSRFVGASNADSFSPRIGLQFDADTRTRVRAAYAPGGDESRAQGVAFFEDTPVIFREQEDAPVALVDGRAVMERSRRLEFGVERVLDNSSSVEATAFFDTTDGRGVGLLSAPVTSFSGENGAALLNVANQQGAARGLRVVYTRRISSFIKASAGYSFGRGQQLSPEGITSPDQIFQDGFFQTAAAQVDADVADGTRVRTVLRFSPGA